MGSLSHLEITTLFLSLAVILTTAIILGEVARRLHQPSVIGEIIAGIILGPTVLGTLFPDLHLFLFPREGNIIIALEGMTTLAIALFLLVAGMEVDLSTVFRQRRSALLIGLAGMIGPFLLGFITAWFSPSLFGYQPHTDLLAFIFFVATAFSISALPVVAKILKDLNLYQTDVGMIIISAAIFNDLMGWLIFAMILNMTGNVAQGPFTLTQKIVLTLGFVVFILTIGRWLIHKGLPWIQAHTSWPAGILGFAISITLFCATFTEWIGIHVIFGAFLFGVALGDSPHLREKTRTTIDQFVSFVFAPLFFASIGLRVNFITNFDWLMVLFVLVIATVGKILSCRLGARWSGLSSREAWAIGFGLNARGAMEIIIGLLALQTGLISERLFVALVIMALITSVTSGSLIQYILRRKKKTRFSEYVASKSFCNPLTEKTAREVIQELVQHACTETNLDAQFVLNAVWMREETMSTGLEHGIAVPHTRLDMIKEPIVAVGISKTGIDFDSVDGQPARLIFLILNPASDNVSQLEILADISRTFHNPETVGKAIHVSNFTEFLALVKSESPHH